MSSPDADKRAKRRRAGKVAAAFVAALVFVLLALISVASGDSEYSTSRFLSAIEARQVERATLYPDADRVKLTLRDGTSERAGYPGSDAGRLVDRLTAAGAEVDVATRRGGLALLFYLLPTGLFIAFWVWLARRLGRLARQSDRAGE